MKQSELDLIVIEHGKWLIDSSKGSRANLRNANLYNANLSNANDQKWFCDGNFHQLTNIGSEKGVLEVYSCGELGWFIRRSCFTGSKSEFYCSGK